MIQNLVKEEIWREVKFQYFDHGRGNNWAMSYSILNTKSKKPKRNLKKEFITHDIKNFDVFEENRALISSVLDFV